MRRIKEGLDSRLLEIALTNIYSSLDMFNETCIELKKCIQLLKKIEEDSRIPEDIKEEVKKIIYNQGE